MLEFHSLASGSKGNCFVVKNGNDILMIDCGGAKSYLVQALSKVNININDINSLLITHGHTDHIAQINTFKNIDIYSACDLKVPYQELTILKPFYVKSFKVTAIPLSHDAKNTVGYIVESQDEKLVYITDTGYIQERYYKMLQNADYIILECNHDLKMLMETNRPMFLKQRIQGDIGHLCNEDGAIILANIVSNKTKEIWLAHLSEEANTPELAIFAVSSALSKLPYKNFRLLALKQYEVSSKGVEYEENHDYSYSSARNLECAFNFNDN